MIELAERDGVAILRMADGKANAMNLEFCRALSDHLENIRRSSARAARGWRSGVAPWS